MADTIETVIAELFMLDFAIDFRCDVYGDYRREKPPGMIVTHWYDGREKEFNLYTANRMHSCANVGEVLTAIIKTLERAHGAV